MSTSTRCPGQGAYIVAATCDGGTEPRRIATSVATSKSGALDVLDVAGLQKVRSFESPHAGRAAEDLSFLSTSSECLVSCGEDGTVQLWDLRVSGSGAQRTLHTETDSPILAVAVDASDRLCACAAGSWIRGLELASGREVFCQADAHSEPAHCLRFRGGNELVSAGDDGLLCVSDVGRCEQGGKAVEDDAGLRLVVNSGDSIRALSLAAEDSALACAISTTEVLQLWSLHEDRPGAMCGRFADVRMDSRLRVDESDGYLVAALYDEASGRAQLLAGAMDGSLAVYRLNLEAASFAGALPSAAGGGHSSIVRAAVQLGRTGRMATCGEDGLLCAWGPGDSGEGAEPPARSRSPPPTAEGGRSPGLRGQGPGLRGRGPGLRGRGPGRSPGPRGRGRGRGVR